MQKPLQLGFFLRHVPALHSLSSQCQTSKRKGQLCHPSVSSVLRTSRLTCFGPVCVCACGCKGEEMRRACNMWLIRIHVSSAPFRLLTLPPETMAIVATRPATSTTAKAARPTRLLRVWPSPGPLACAAAMLDALCKLSIGCIYRSRLVRPRDTLYSVGATFWKGTSH